MAIPRTLLVWLSALSLLSLTAYLWNPHPQAHLVLQPTQPSAVVHPPPPSSALHKLKRVAILGAGSSGSSSAFFLSRAAQQMAGEAEVEIVVFEREGRVGGRSTTVRPYRGEGGREIELGASIFVDANRNLHRAVQAFNLSLVPFADDRPSAGHDPYGMGLWDVQTFLLTTSTSLGWWEKAKILWRYGYVSPTRTTAAVGRLVERFGQLYERKWVRENAPWRQVEGLGRTLGLDLGGVSPEEVSGEEWFKEQVKVGERWTEEMVEAILRVNYGQTVDRASGLAASVSLATTGASSVQGGNWQVFDRFLLASGAEVRLGTKVESITGFVNSDTGLPQYTVRTNGSTSSREEDFDAVLFGGPFHQCGVDLRGTLEMVGSLIPKQPYVHLHVTLLTTTSPSLNASYFSLPPSSSIPSTILTTLSTHRTDPSSPRPEFNSITYHGETAEGSGEWVVKIFSESRREEGWLEEVFGGRVGWVLRKEWEAYPLLPPSTTFPPIQPLPTEPFFYLAALEPWISTMETQTLSGRNAVALLASEWWGLEQGVCGEDQGELEGGGWDWTC